MLVYFLMLLSLLVVITFMWWRELNVYYEITISTKKGMTIKVLLWSDSQNVFGLPDEYQPSWSISWPSFIFIRWREVLFFGTQSPLIIVCHWIVMFLRPGYQSILRVRGKNTNNWHLVPDILKSPWSKGLFCWPAYVVARVIRNYLEVNFCVSVGIALCNCKALLMDVSSRCKNISGGQHLQFLLALEYQFWSAWSMPHM